MTVADLLEITSGISQGHTRGDMTQKRAIPYHTRLHFQLFMARKTPVPRNPYPPISTWGFTLTTIIIPWNGPDLNGSILLRSPLELFVFHHDLLRNRRKSALKRVGVHLVLTRNRRMSPLWRVRVCATRRDESNHNFPRKTRPQIGSGHLCQLQRYPD